MPRRLPRRLLLPCLPLDALKDRAKEEKEEQEEIDGRGREVDKVKGNGYKKRLKGEYEMSRRGESDT